MTRRRPDAGRSRAFTDRGPVARTLPASSSGKAIAARCSRVIIISALLLPLLYMVTTSFQQPGADRDAGRAGLAGQPRRPGTYEGQEYPIYTVPIDGVDART